jgi:predicted Zn-ribbon and HTH transcriptional regulator
MKTCPNCSHEFKVPAFKLWSGRCPQCDHGMTHATRREDREHLQRPVATSEEFAEFLKYADDLAAMRLRGDEVGQLMAIFIFGGFLWLFGIGFRLIEFVYGVFYAVCVGVTFASAFWWKLRSRCPRCKGKFGHPVSIRISTFGFGARSVVLGPLKFARPAWGVSPMRK